MNDAERLERVSRLRREEVERGDVGWWYLSFSDGGFRGGCFVSAFGMVDAIAEAHMLGINPGGSVAGGRVSPEMDVPEGARKRLLSKDDLVRYFGDVEVVRR